MMMEMFVYSAIVRYLYVCMCVFKCCVGHRGWGDLLIRLGCPEDIPKYSRLYLRMFY